MQIGEECLNKVVYDTGGHLLGKSISGQLLMFVTSL